MKRLLPILAMLIVSQVVVAQEKRFQLAPLFTDNMVLQQKRSVPVWGKGTPGSSITLRASWKKEAATTVDHDGSWTLVVATPPAGGPYTIDVRHDDTTLTLKNVLIGEVWLCSGQSNMEMPLEGWPPDTILRPADEIRNSTLPGIRLFAVKRAYSPTPEDQCAGNWTDCSPETSPTFSATAYFFGRKLSQTLHVPIGLIHASWGGTPIQAWTGADFMMRVAGFDTTLTKIRANIESMKSVRAWLEKFPVLEMNKRDRNTMWQNLDFQDEECSSREYNDSSWRVMRLPTIWERTGLGQFDGTVWFRKQVTIPAAWVHKDLVLELGPIDDMDVTFANGRKVGSHESRGMYKIDRVYPLPKEIVDTTTITIAVRVVDNGGGGGIYGKVSSMSIHPEGLEERVSLAGDWKFLPVADFRGDKFYVFGSKGERFLTRPEVPLDFSGYSPTALYNGMISPLIPYSLAGFIWYQGEENTNAPAMYRMLFPLMIENWRHAFNGKEMPFYFVQIAPFAYGGATHSEFLREAQFATLAVKNTGMAVTMDIGEAGNIHPANKQEVGNRLALWALAKTYHKKLEYSGPLYRSSRKFADRIELSFDYAGKGLVVTQAEHGNGFEIAGEDRVFKDATVIVRGNRLIVSDPGMVRPQAVRYAFSNTVRGTLFNTAGLPSPSFRTDDWPR